MSELEERHARNQKIIDEFRSNAGKVGGPFENIPLLILHNRGAKSGQERLNPVAYRRDGDNFVVFASKGGAPDNPDWFHNLKANPDTTVQIGRERRNVRARVANPEERARLWPKAVKTYGGYADYQARAPREIPVVILERR